MTSKMNNYASSVKEYEVREETLNGRQYIAVPVTMMVEGVHPGSHGPLLHTAEELGKIPESWNGIPVTIGHPKVDGKYVSANSPTVLESWAIGIVFNTFMNDVRLKSEAWLEKTKLALNENLSDRIANGEIIEISVGVFSEDEPVEGIHNNVQYVGVARNLRPDHLAILPNETGACSVDKGCGIRTNSNNMEINEENKLEILQQLNNQGFTISELVVNKSLLKLIEKIRAKIYSMDSDGEWYYVEDVDDTYVIYTKSVRDAETKLYKQGYAIAADESVTFIGDPVEVEKKVEYETVQTNNTVPKRRRINNQKKEEIMSKQECTPCVKRRVNALIANTMTQFNEDDREWLETLEEDQLNRMDPVKENVAPATITPDMAVNALRSGLTEQDDFIRLMPTNMQEQMRSALKVFQDKKVSLINGILANTEEGTWTKEELEVYEVEKLEKISKTASRATSNVPNYSGLNAGATLQNNAQAEMPVMAPVGIEFESKK